MAPVRDEEKEPEDNGNSGMALQDSDFEPEESDKHEFITDAMGWNVSPVVEG
jgi:hypothetical protein